MGCRPQAVAQWVQVRWHLRRRHRPCQCVWPVLRGVFRSPYLFCASRLRLVGWRCSAKGPVVGLTAGRRRCGESERFLKRGACQRVQMPSTVTVSLDKVGTRTNLMQSSLHWLLQRHANGSLSASFASGFAHGAHRAANVLEGAPGNTNESAHGGFTWSVLCPTQASVQEDRHPGRCDLPDAPSAHPLCAAVRV